MISSRKAIKIIEADGWKWVRTTGDHRHFRHPTKPGITTVPHPNKDLTIKTIKSIEKQSGVRLR